MGETNQTRRFTKWPGDGRTGGERVVGEILPGSWLRPGVGTNEYEMRGEVR